MTPEQRKQEFDRLFESIPGKNIEKIRKVCSILHYKENTVRTARMKNPPKIMPERMLTILRDALEKEAKELAAKGKNSK